MLCVRLLLGTLEGLAGILEIKWSDENLFYSYFCGVGRQHMCDICATSKKSVRIINSAKKRTMSGGGLSFDYYEEKCDNSPIQQYPDLASVDRQQKKVARHFQF